MANTITAGPNMVTIAPDGSTAWDSTTLYPHGVLIEAIKFFPNSANDICIIRTGGSDTGPIICKMKDVAGSGTADGNFGRTAYKPYLKGSEGVSGSLIIIIFK